MGYTGERYFYNKNMGIHVFGIDKRSRASVSYLVPTFFGGIKNAYFIIMTSFQSNA